MKQLAGTFCRQFKQFILAKDTLHGKILLELAPTLIDPLLQLLTIYFVNHAVLFTVLTLCYRSKGDVHCQLFYHAASVIYILQQPRDCVISFCMHGGVGCIILAGLQGRSFPYQFTKSRCSHTHGSLQCYQSVVVLSHVDSKCGSKVMRDSSGNELHSFLYWSVESTLSS